MIDFVRISCRIVRGELLEHPLLDFNFSVNHKTGEYKNCMTAKYKNLIFVLKGNYFYIAGSLHKYYNGGYHNYDDFSYSNLVKIIIGLCRDFRLNPNNLRIENLEFGVNLTVPFDPTKFLKENIINYKGQPKSRNVNLDGIGYLIEFEKSNYIVKVYDKGKQYNQRENILRFEIRTRKMEHIKKTGIKTLADLFDLSKLKILEEILINSFDNLLIYDQIDLTELNQNERELFQNGINPDYWYNLKPDRSDFEKGNNKEYHKQRKIYYSKKKRFENLLDTKGLTRTKQSLRILIQEKCQQLLKTNEKTKDKLSNYLRQHNQTNENLVEDSFSGDGLHIIIGEGQINTIYKRLN